jgi:hypothetical protein
VTLFLDDKSPSLAGLGLGAQVLLKLPSVLSITRYRRGFWDAKVRPLAFQPSLGSR